MQRILFANLDNFLQANWYSFVSLNYQNPFWFFQSHLLVVSLNVCICWTSCPKYTIKSYNYTCFSIKVWASRTAEQLWTCRVPGVFQAFLISYGKSPSTMLKLLITAHRKVTMKSQGKIACDVWMFPKGCGCLQDSTGCPSDSQKCQTPTVTHLIMWPSWWYNGSGRREKV